MAEPEAAEKIGSPTEAPRWAEDVVFYAPGKNAMGDCALSDQQLALDCAREAATGETDGQTVGIGQDGVLEVLFRSGPIVNLKGNDVRLHMTLANASLPLVRASRSGSDYETFTLNQNHEGDLSIAGLSDASFIEVINTGTEALELDALESLSADGSSP